MVVGVADGAGAAGADGAVVGAEEAVEDSFSCYSRWNPSR